MSADLNDMRKRAAQQAQWGNYWAGKCLGLIDKALESFDPDSPAASLPGVQLMEADLRAHREHLIDTLEHRGERYGADRDPSVIKHPNGTSMVCSDADLVVSLTKAVLEMNDEGES
jgi:hypothetical protein